MNEDLLKRLDAVGSSLSKAVGVIADKVDQAAPHVYGVLVRQSYVNGVSDLGLAVGLLFLALMAKRMFDRFYVDGKPESKRCREDGNIVALLFLSLGMCAFCIASLCSAVEGIQYLLNPEYYAIMSIVSMVK